MATSWVGMCLRVLWLWLFRDGSWSLGSLGYQAVSHRDRGAGSSQAVVGSGTTVTATATTTFTR